MSSPSLSNYSIYIRLDEQTVHNYFNQHDPAPLYKRQLDHEFEQYINNYLLTSKRDAVIKYQVVCMDYADKRFVSPVMQAIRNHFELKKNLKEEEFHRPFFPGNISLCGRMAGRADVRCPAQCTGCI